MLLDLRHQRPWLIVLILLSLSLGVGGRMNLCLLPDGGVHLEEHHCVCQQPGGQGQGGHVESEGDLSDDHGACLDLTLEEGASPQQQRGIPLVPLPALATQPAPGLPALTAIPLPRDPKPANAAPLLALRTVVLLI